MKRKIIKKHMGTFTVESLKKPKTAVEKLKRILSLLNNKITE